MISPSQPIAWACRPGEKLDRVQNAHIACHRTGICIRICIGNVSNASGACHQNSVVAANIFPIHCQPAHLSKNTSYFFWKENPQDLNASLFDFQLYVVK